MKYKEQRAQNKPLLKPMKEATHLNLAAIQLDKFVFRLPI